MFIESVIVPSKDKGVELAHLVGLVAKVTGREQSPMGALAGHLWWANATRAVSDGSRLPPYNLFSCCCS